MAANMNQRPRIASPWLVTLLAAVVLLIFYAAWPRGGVRERMMFSAAPSELSVAYLEAWLRAKPTSPEFLALLGEQYARLGRLDDALHIAQRMDALNSEPMRRKALLLRLSVAEQQTFAIPASDPLRAAASAKLRAQFAAVASLAWPTPDLQMLAQRAAAADAPQLAMQLYERLAAQDPARHTQWNTQASRYALFTGDYPHAAAAWFREQDAATTLDAQRRDFLAGIRALQSGNMLNEALAAADQHAGVLAEDKETLIVLLNLARAANRPDLERRYATALARFAAVQPEARAMLRYASFRPARRATAAGPQTPYAYMDGPQANGYTHRRFAAGTRGWGTVHVQRVAATTPAANVPAASGAKTGNPAGTKSAPAANSAANGDVAGLVFQSFVEAGDLASAQKIASEQVAKDPHSAVWLKRLAQIAEWNNASPLALKSWLAYAEMSNDPAAWANVLRIAPMLDDDHAWLAALTHASRANPDNLKLVDDVVATYERLGLPDEALAFLAALPRGTQGEAIDDRMGTLSERAGKDDAALAIYHRMQMRSPGNATYALRTASLLYRHGDYKGAFDALQKARNGAKNDDEAFWRNYAQLARLLQQDTAANDGYAHLLAAGVATPEDLGDMTYFYDPWPIDAARTSELQYRHDGTPRALQNALYYYTEAQAPERVRALLASLTPAQLAAAEADPGFLGARAEYYRLTDRPFDALHDLQHAMKLPGAPNDLRTALLWMLVDYGTDSELRAALATWRDSAQRTSSLWEPYAAAELRLDRPVAALGYLRLEAATMSRDPLWLLAYADAQEAAGRPDLAWSIRRKVWVQMQNEEQAVATRGRGASAALKRRAGRDADTREQLAGQTVTLATIFENGDVSKALLDSLFAKDPSRQKTPLERRSLLGDVHGLPPVASKDAVARDDGRLKSAVAKDVAVAWALSTESLPLAKRWLARQYASRLLQPGDAQLAIALADGDTTTMNQVLDREGGRLPIDNRIDALSAVDRPDAAQRLAFRGLEGAPDNTDLHTRVVETALDWPQSIDASVTSYVEHPLDYIEQTLSGSRKIAERYMVGVTGIQRFQHSTDETQLINVPSVDRSFEFFARRQTLDSALMVTAGRREALDSFYTLALDGETGRNSPLTLSAHAGRNETATETQTLQVGGMKDNLIAGLTYRVTERIQISGTVEADRFYSQARAYLGSGILSNGEIAYRFHTVYPDFTLRLVGTRGSYGASGQPDALISGIVPAGAGLAGAFIPDTYAQYGLYFGFGNDLREQYTHRWRPFMDVGILHDSIQGWGPQLSVGVAGTVFGGDHLSMFLEHDRVTRVGTPVTEIGARYSWFY
ncbi:hypothetical protein R54767_02809 [Paraburkholderia gardini]|uniref:PelB C-terminal domain-containing protein n=2 Tax=Paraburkholderia gardini TaxID=2823469 RepID=A0ABM8U4M2_9BURK|nr:hypothetical protein R54767_02809 [Paraburkholderia gardini]